MYFISILFWFGDLNYRLNNNGDLIKEYVSKGKIEELLEFDQVLHHCYYIFFKSLYNYNNYYCRNYYYYYIINYIY